jgi:hypothetical protein
VVVTRHGTARHATARTTPRPAPAASARRDACGGRASIDASAAARARQSGRGLSVALPGRRAAGGHRRRGAVCHESVVAIDAAATARIRGAWRGCPLPAADPPLRVDVLPKEMARQLFLNNCLAAAPALSRPLLALRCLGASSSSMESARPVTVVVVVVGGWTRSLGRRESDTTRNVFCLATRAPPRRWERPQAGGAGMTTPRAGGLASHWLPSCVLGTRDSYRF